MSNGDEATQRASDGPDRGTDDGPGDGRRLSFVARMLNWVERVGNRLPDPITLFLLGTLVVLAISQIAVWQEWSVDKTVIKKEKVEGVEHVGKETVTVKPRGLLSGDDAYWVINNLVKNFTGFAPLGIVLVGMLGIGVAERRGRSMRS